MGISDNDDNNDNDNEDRAPPSTNQDNDIISTGKIITATGRDAMRLVMGLTAEMLLYIGANADEMTTASSQIKIFGNVMTSAAHRMANKRISYSVAFKVMVNT
jgi:hypothetical protein